MLKNHPILSFDQDQKTWCLDFTEHEMKQQAKEKTESVQADKLTRLLQEYWNKQKKNASIDSFDNNQKVKRLKWSISGKNDLRLKNRTQQDNLFFFLKEHQDAYTLRENIQKKQGLMLKLSID